jgi:hypothetical protein
MNLLVMGEQKNTTFVHTQNKLVIPLSPSSNRAGNNFLEHLTAYAIFEH